MSVVIDRSNMLHTIECLVVENGKREKALSKFVRWFNTYEPTWSTDYRESDEFLDLRDIYDVAKEALR